MFDKKRIEILQKQNAKLKERLNELDSELSRYKALETAMNDAKKGYENALEEARKARSECVESLNQLKLLIKDLDIRG